MDALALQLETDAQNAWAWSSISVYRVDGTLGNTDRPEKH